MIRDGKTQARCLLHKTRTARSEKPSFISYPRIKYQTTIPITANPAIIPSTICQTLVSFSEDSFKLWRRLPACGYDQRWQNAGKMPAPQNPNRKI